MNSVAIPDPLTRLGIRALLLQRKFECWLKRGGQSRLLAELATAPTVVHADEANQQHYELPPQFFELVLGRWLKYSSGYWELGTTELSDAEAAMLRLTCDRAELEDGMTVLDFGCGWGSLSRWILAHYPRCRIVAVSNSRPQREWILSHLSEAERARIEVITTDVSQFRAAQSFDRVISIEMFEHVRNHQPLFEEIRRSLVPGGKFFLHVFAHQKYTYLFETGGASNWMGRYFFTGGMMPAHGYFTRFTSVLPLGIEWRVSGVHYAKTAEAWLQNTDRHREEILKIFAAHYGKERELWLQRWRVFFMACAESFRFGGGDEWAVSHYLFTKPNSES